MGPKFGSCIVTPQSFGNYIPPGVKPVITPGKQMYPAAAHQKAQTLHAGSNSANIQGIMPIK